MHENRRTTLWMLAMLVCGAAAIALYPDADQQDSGYHFLFARWGWNHPEYLVSVWARPLFTVLYSLPAQAGYTAARVLTLLIALLTAWQSVRVAQHLGLERPELAVPLLFLQPVFWELSTGVFTETLFALILIIALRLHLTGRITAAMLAASTLILVRPEGFFLGIFWGCWRLGSVISHWKEASREACWRGILGIGLLATGFLAWWSAALLMTGDPLWILHHWPPDWQATGQANGVGPIWWYTALLPLIVGPFFLPQFIGGVRRSLPDRRLLPVAATFLTLFVIHSLLYARGWFGAAGYARYFVCVAPATALLTLRGWSRRLAIPAILLEVIFCIGYNDALIHGRDAIAATDLHRQFVRSPQWQSLPVSRLVCSQAYMRILFDRDHWEMPALSGDRQQNLAILRQLPPETIVFWDDETGPKWYKLDTGDFRAAGFELLLSHQYQLEGRFVRLPRLGFGGVRQQSMSILYKRQGRH